MRELVREDGFRVRLASAEDAPAMVHILGQAFDRWPPVETTATPLEHLQWKLSSPDAARGSHYVLEHDGEIVGAKLSWMGHADLEGERVITDNGADFAVAPAFQGRGLGRLLAEFEEQGTQPRGDISVEPLPQHAAVLHMRYPSADLPLRVLERPLSTRSTLSLVAGQLRARDPKQTARTATTALGRVRHRLRRAPTVEVVTFTRFDERTDALWAAAAGQFDFARARDAEYLNWRYADPRGGARTLLGAFEGTRALAVAMLIPVDDAFQLSDLIVHPQHPATGIAVLERAAEFGRALGLDRLTAWLAPEHVDQPTYDAAGFVATGEITVAHHLPRGVKEPDLVPRFRRPGLRRHETLGDFDFA